MNRRALISALRRAVGGGARQAERAAPVASDLPMDTTSRLSRARAQGFDTDTTLYHGRPRDFTGDAPRPSPSGFFGPGLYTTKSPERASWYASSRHGAPSEAANVLPVYARGKIATQEEFDALARKYRPNRRFRAGDTERIQEKVVAELKRRGYAGIDGRGADDETLIFDMANVRSKFARFDPARSNAANIMAGAGGLAALGGMNAIDEEFK